MVTLAEEILDCLSKNYIAASSSSSSSPSPLSLSSSSSKSPSSQSTSLPPVLSYKELKQAMDANRIGCQLSRYRWRVTGHLV
jgi:hypothetical protein